MNERFLSDEVLIHFIEHLTLAERSRATVEKYARDVRAFSAFCGSGAVTKEQAIAYKNKLKDDGYALRSINSMIASINSLFSFLGWYDLKVRMIRVQQQIFCPAEKELTRQEYERLVRAAKTKQSERLSLILQTICGTGIRVSELQFFTVEAIRSGGAVVSCKGKTRTVFIVRDLQKKLLRYAKKQGIMSGCIFITRTGKPVTRSNIWKEMKALCADANVNPEKVFPHNLRHLFARVFYGLDKDIARLADILGHSSINTTRNYIISTGFEHRKRMESMHLIM